MVRGIQHITLAQMLSLILLVSSLVMTSSQYDAVSAEEISSEKPSENDKEVQNQWVVSDAIQTSFQLDLTFHSFLLETVQVIVSQTTPVLEADRFVPGISKNFRILLRRIISPNAP
jgi:hypothetical protein